MTSPFLTRYLIEELVMSRNDRVKHLLCFRKRRHSHNSLHRQHSWPIQVTSNVERLSCNLRFSPSNLSFPLLQFWGSPCTSYPPSPPKLPSLYSTLIAKKSSSSLWHRSKEDLPGGLESCTSGWALIHGLRFRVFSVVARLTDSLSGLTVLLLVMTLLSSGRRASVAAG